MRSGTENVLGIETVKVALEEILREQNPRELERSKKALYQGLKEINSQIIFIADNAKNKNLNTLFFIIPNQSGQTLQMKFDMNGLAVSTGSACSSGIIKENRIVRALGFSKEEALSCIRLSLPFNFKESDVANVIQKLEKILK
jgi:cysteine desulfurase